MESQGTSYPLDSIRKCSHPVIMAIEVCCRKICLTLTSIHTTSEVELFISVDLDVTSHRSEVYTFTVSSLWESLVSAISHVKDNAFLSRIVAVVITGDPNNILIIDKEFVPISPILYATFHTTSPPQIERFHFLKRTTPSIDPANIGYILTVQDYLRFVFSGCPVTSVSDAFVSGLWKVQDCCWNDEILSKHNLHKEMFPSILDSRAVIGPISNIAASQLLLPETCAIVNGGDSYACSALGLGVTASKQAVIQFSQCILLVISLPQPVESPVFWSLFKPIPAVESGKILATTQLQHWDIPEISMSTSPTTSLMTSSTYCPVKYNPLDPQGLDASALFVQSNDFMDLGLSCLKKFNDKLEPSPPRLSAVFFNNIIESIPYSKAGSKGILFIPHFPSERSRNVNNIIKNRFISTCQIEINTIDNNIYKRCYLESLMFRFRFCLDRIPIESKPTIVSISIPLKLNESRSNVLFALAQMIADITGLLVVVSNNGSAGKGAGILGAFALKLFNSLDEAIYQLVSSKLISPNSNNQYLYNALYNYWLDVVCGKLALPLEDDVIRSLS
ncbi:hypothetical protein P9112_003432 [Eukaryota sp. TZLM1-RC]